MQSSYIATIDRIITKYEGNYGWDRGDPGGPTKYGITCYDLAEHRHQKMTSMTTWAPIVKAMGLPEAEEIYNTKYATGVRYADLPLGIDACMLDYGINSGVSRPIAVARALMRVKGSGAIDQTLLDAIKKTNVDAFIKNMDAERLAFMHAIQGGRMWAKFGHGWQTRVTDLTAYCLHLADAKNPAPIAPDLSNVVTPKAVHTATTAGTATSVGLVAAGGAAYVAGFDWKYIALAAGVVAVLGIIYEVWQAHKTTTANAAVVLPAGA
jgi:lysozyme family protein